VIWTTAPTQWDNGFFANLFGYEWELVKSPAGAHQWRPTDRAADDTVPDAHDPSKRHAPMMLTTDLSLRFDPIYEPIFPTLLRASRRVRRRVRPGPGNKLTHRDMAPSRAISVPRFPPSS